MMERLRRIRLGQKGQALIETAYVIIVFYVLTLGFVGEGLQVTAREQVQQAARLATVSALQAPLGDRGDALTYAENTFFATMSHEAYVTAAMNGCTEQEYFGSGCPSSDNPGAACSGDYLSGIEHSENGEYGLSCTFSDIEVLYYKVGPLAMLWPGTVEVAPITVQVYPSSYRSCYQGETCNG